MIKNYYVNGRNRFYTVEFLKKGKNDAENSDFFMKFFIRKQ